ncbi:iron ABC transporter permease [Patescibacteria group bacterium]|nr:iron ABC transporter permease [Patescibacteria group bacterium]
MTRRGRRYSIGKTLVLAGCYGAVFILILYPLIMLFRGSFINPNGHPTIEYIKNLVTDRAISESFLNTLIISSGATLLSILVGAPMGWALSRTNMPLKSLIRNVSFLSLLTPPFLGAIAWVFLLGPRAGKINLLIREIFHTKLSFNIFSTPGIIFVSFLFVYPFVLLATASSLDNTDPSLEQAGRMLGASTWKTNLKITFPLVLPAIIGGAILSFLEVSAFFGIPSVLGMPMGIYTLPSRIYYFYQTFPPQFEQGAATAIPLLLLTAMLLLTQRLFIGRKKFTVITGKAEHPQLIELGKWKYAMLAFCLLIISLSIFIPYSTLLVVSLSKVWGIPLSLDNLTLDNFKFILFGYRMARVSIKNSFFLAVMAASLGLVLAFISSLIVERTKLKGKGFISFLIMVPFAIPGIAMATGFLWAYISPPFVLYGTIWILLVAYIARRTPLAFSNCRNGIRQLNPELEESATNLGASWMKTLKEVTIPLIKGSLVTSWIFIFILSFRELSTSILLYTPNSEVMAVTIYTLYEGGEFEALSALAILLLGVILIGVYLARKIVGKGFMEIRR